MMKYHRSLSFALFVLAAAMRLANAGPIVTIASDAASDPAYSDGWDKGDDGGKGFGEWQLSFNGQTSQLDPVYGGRTHFIDGADAGPLSGNGLGPRAFGITTGGQLDSAVAERSLDQPLSLGQSFSIEIDGSAYEVGQFTGIGNKFQLLGADGIPRYELSSTSGGSNFWQSNGSNTGVRYDEPVRFSLSLRPDERFSASVQSINAGIGYAAFNRPLIGTPGMPITGIRFENIGTRSSMDGARELFFDDLRVTEFVPEPAAATLVGLSLLAVLGLMRRR